MDRWIRSNEGLYRRIAYTFDFQDYTPLELAEILHHIVEQKGFVLESSFQGDVGKSRLASLLDVYTSPRARQLMNGGVCERIFEAAKQCLDERDNPSQPSIMIVETDIVAACRRIPLPPGSASPLVATASQQSQPTSTSSASYAIPLAVASKQRFLIVRLHNGLLVDCSTLGFVAGVMTPVSAYVVVSFGGGAGQKMRHAWKSHNDKDGHLEPSWEETVVLPLLPEDHLLDVSVYDQPSLMGDIFLGSAQLALSAVPRTGFNGKLELRRADCETGTIRLELQLQAAAGSDSL
jgi:hypothetical protein